MGLFRKDRPIHAIELTGNATPSSSKPYKDGRRLLLKFIGDNHPELDRIAFRWNETSEEFFWQQSVQTNAMSWSKIPQGLSLLFLDTLAAENPVGPVYLEKGNGGDLPRALDNAIGEKKSKLSMLFAERQPSGRLVTRIKTVFSAKNLRGKNKGEHRVFVQADCLSNDCIDVFWSAHSKERITDRNVFRVLAQRIRKDLKIEVKQEIIDALPPSVSPPPQPPPPVPKSQTELVLPQSLLSSFERMTEAAGKFFERRSGARKAPTVPPIPQATQGIAKKEPEKTASVPPRSEPKAPWKQPAIPAIPPDLFLIHNPEKWEWSDQMGLINFGTESATEDDLWRLKDACEGVLIMGAPGSGKTSGSAFALAQAFLRQEFGGLVLCAKTDEARRWKGLCERFGRSQDCVVVDRESAHRLNALAYESQRPGKRIGLTDDLISFFRVLISIVSKQNGPQMHDDFWVKATNQLMRWLFEAFLLAGEPMAIESLTRFVLMAPDKRTEEWRKIEFFGDILSRAEKNAVGEEDRAMFRQCSDYWTIDYPKISPPTRSGIRLGFTTMADCLSGRGIRELMSSETNLTPEMILSGKIVILDLPLKDCGQGGLMVQAAWKYLFQRAIERRSDKGQNTARPVFLWEDEGHLFFSQHDVDFQPTTRDCRASHVIVSQNLHNFYQLGNSRDAVLAVFATMNTQIFHANGDLETNQWASDKLGTALKTQVQVSIQSQPKRSSDPLNWFWDALTPEQRESTSNTTIHQQREKVFEPEEFSRLKKGGDGTCQAVVLWVSHEFKCNESRPFRTLAFDQDNIRI